MRFHDGDDAADARAVTGSSADGLLRLLLAQDGSTTRLCEAIAREPVRLLVHRQRMLSAPPAALGALLPGGPVLERAVSLFARGQVMLDALSYIAPGQLCAELRRDLEAGATPLGRLLERMWVRREFLPPEPALCEPLWQLVGQPDMAATRCLRIVTPQGPCMVITETFRRGMRQNAQASGTSGRAP